VKQAAEHGFDADESGKMIKPPNYEELRAQMYARLWEGVQNAVE